MNSRNNASIISSRPRTAVSRAATGRRAYTTGTVMSSKVDQIIATDRDGS